MRIMRVIGLALAIIILKILTPHIWSAFADTLIALFGTFQNALEMTASIISSLRP